MRVTYALWLALAVIGCSRVDSNRTTTLDDHTKPNPTTGDVARPEANAPDSAAPVPATTSSSGTGSSSASTSLDRDTTASGEATSRDNPAPNNTAINQRDRDPDAKTPINQDENQSDVSKTADIRQRIVNAENMSINARNVKIITSKGKVTLRGPVNSAAEREAIVRFAREVAGEGNVDDQLEVKADATNTSPATNSPQP